jgi:hypothetical protein
MAQSFATAWNVWEQGLSDAYHAATSRQKTADEAESDATVRGG